MCVYVCLCLSPDLIPPLPLFLLILLIPLFRHQAFPLMKCLVPYTVLTFYLFSFIRSPFSNLSSVSPFFIVFGSLSVILQGAVIKGEHIEGALHRFVILFTPALPFFAFHFLFVAADLVGEMAVR